MGVGTGSCIWAITILPIALYNAIDKKRAELHPNMEADEIEDVAYRINELER
jgi:hypothetical protein